MVAFSDTTGYISQVGKDPYGLGQWCWTLHEGSEGRRTRCIVVYNACTNNKKDSQTTYQQQHQYFITKKKDLTCPNKLFRHHLLRGSNYPFYGPQRQHHIYYRPLGRALADTSGLGLREAVLQHTGTQTGATCFRGSSPIDGLWVSSNIGITNVCVCRSGMELVIIACLFWT